MDWDDDAPPDLVGAETGLEPEEKPVKVPITIVTGECLSRIHVPLLWVSQTLTETVCRIFGRGQDDAPELHPDRRAWQEDRRHHEW